MQSIAVISNRRDCVLTPSPCFDQKSGAASAMQCYYYH